MPSSVSTTRPSSSRLARARSRWTSSGQTPSSRARATLPSASRSTAIRRPRTWRSVPAQAWPRRGGPSYAGRPAMFQAHSRLIGHASQRGLAAVQTRAPSSITATAQVAASSSGTSASARSRSALVTRAGRELLAAHRAGQHPAHVGVQHGMAGPEREGRDRAGGVVTDPRQGEQLLPARRAPHRRAGPRWPSPPRAGAAPDAGSRAGPTPALPHHWAPRREQPGVGQVDIQDSKTGSTRTTGVCCSMNSETITAHGVASGRRQGRSRACSAYQSRTGRCSCVLGLGVHRDH